MGKPAPEKLSHSSFNKARDDRVKVASAEPYANRSRQITTPAPHHSIFYGPDALPDSQPTVSKH